MNESGSLPDCLEGARYQGKIRFQRKPPYRLEAIVIAIAGARIGHAAAERCAAEDIVAQQPRRPPPRTPCLNRQLQVLDRVPTKACQRADYPVVSSSARIACLN